MKGMIVLYFEVPFSGINISDALINLERETLPNGVYLLNNSARRHELLLVERKDHVADSVWWIQ